MKYILSPLFGLFLFFSCNQPDPNTPLIERNPEVKEYFETMEEVVDEYCNMIEKMVVDAQAIEDKEEKGEEADFMDGLKMFTNMGTSMMKMAKLAKKIDKMEKRHPEFEEELSDADFEEFMGIYSKVIKRFYEMGKKFEKLEQEKKEKKEREAAEEPADTLAEAEVAETP